MMHAPFVMRGRLPSTRDGEGTLLVTEACLLSAGRNPAAHEGRDRRGALPHDLGANKVLWLPRGIDGDETNEHVDNVCAFARPGEVVLAWTDDPDRPAVCAARRPACIIWRPRRTRRAAASSVHKLPHPARAGPCHRRRTCEGYDL